MKLSEFISTLQKFQGHMDGHDPELILMLDDVEVECTRANCDSIVTIPVERGDLGLVSKPVWEDEAFLYLKEK